MRARQARALQQRTQAAAAGGCSSWDTRRAGLTAATQPLCVRRQVSALIVAPVLCLHDNAE